MQSITTPEIHSENEHAIVALLCTEISKQAAYLQNQLVQIFDGAIWLQRSPGLHITLMEIICDTDYHNLSCQQHFEQWYEKYNQITKEVLEKYPPFAVTFDQLLVSQRAIIIKAADTRMFNTIREDLLSKIRLPDGTKMPPDITHCTLARFNKVIDLERVVHLTSTININFVEHITEFSLVKDLGPPDFNGIPMQIYPLRQP